MSRGPAQAAKLLSKVVRVDSGPRTAVEWLAEIALTFQWFEEEAHAHEAAERWERDFIVVLRAQMASLQKLGRFCVFAFNSSSEYMIQGAYYEEPRDSESLKVAKGKRRRFVEYVSALQRLDPRGFEAVCVGILSEFGVQRPVLTQYSADEGVDFYGRLTLKGLLFENDLLPNISDQMGVWLVGQAKHYRKSHVSTFDVRDLVGAVSLSRARAFGASSPKYFDLLIRSCDSVFYLIFSTGQLSDRTWNLVRRTGVIAMDGDMVASFLADRGIGVENGAFNAGRLRAWVADNERKARSGLVLE